MTDLRSLTLSQLADLCADIGWEPYRAKQIYSWVWQKGITDLDAMTNLSKDKRAELAHKYRVQELTEERRLTDEDGTVKFTWRLSDGAIVESVFIPEPDRRTVCVSTQIGCSLACSLCLTGRMGFKRNLAWYEIAGQVLEVKRKLQGIRGSNGQVAAKPGLEPANPGTRKPHPVVTNVVFMGMGEPFLNYEAVLEALTQLNSDIGLNLGARKMTVSTAGIPDRVREYGRFPLQTRLAVSLNASDNETRDQLMPINRRYPLEELIPAVREFTQVKDKRVTFEYVLIDGVNNRKQDIVQLTRLLEGIPCKLNLIPFNPVPDCNYRPPSVRDVERFAQSLYPLLPAVTIRRSRGAGILAACGQLAGLT